MERFEQRKRCCNICDAKTKCHVCDQSTLYACSDCCIDFGVTASVCPTRQCQSAHEEKCSARLREKCLALLEEVERLREIEREQQALDELTDRHLKIDITEALKP